jgi:capsular polysaccharide biosynthesis protein
MSQTGKPLSLKSPIIAGILIACVAVSVTSTLTSHPLYSAAATMAFPLSSGSSADDIRATLGLTEQTSSQLQVAEVMKSRSVLGAVAKEVNLSLNAASKALEVEPSTITGFITVRWTGPDPEQPIVALQSILAKVKVRMVEARQAIINVDASKRLWLQASTQADEANKRSIAFQLDKGQSLANSSVAQRISELAVSLRVLDKQEEQARNRLASLSASSKDLPLSVPPSGKWRDKLISLQYDLERSRIDLGSEAPEVKRLVAEISLAKQVLENEVDSYLRAAMEGRVVAEAASAQLPDLAAISTKRLLVQSEYATLKALAEGGTDAAIVAGALDRNRIVAEEAAKQAFLEYAVVTRRYEGTGASWFVVDSPALDKNGEPVNKSLLAAGIYGLVAGVALTILLMAFQRLRASATAGPGSTESAR